MHSASLRPTEQTDKAVVASAHTPGPWTAHHGWHDKWIDPDVQRKHPKWCEVTGPDDGPVLSITGHFGLANARLIAAAPDLLAALILALPYVEDASDSASPADQAVIHAAIAKATAQ